MKIRQLLFTSAALPAAVLLAATAFAQMRPTPSTPDRPTSQAPSTSQSPSTVPSMPSMGPSTGSPGGTGAGAGTSTASPGQAGYNASEAVRTARFEARIATIKAGLMLTEEQQRLWPAVESAIRDAFRQQQEGMERMRGQSMPTDFVERLQRRGEMMSAHGAAMTRLAEAIKPLHATLSEEQRRRVASLMRRGMDGGRGPGMMGDHMGGYDRRGMGGDRDWGRERDRGDRYGSYGRGGMYGHHRWHDDEDQRGQYGRGKYGRGEYSRGEYGRGEYGRGEYGRGMYDRYNRRDRDWRGGSRWNEDDGRYRQGMGNGEYGQGGYGQRGSSSPSDNDNDDQD